jgi:hypothetical protein
MHVISGRKQGHLILGIGRSIDAKQLAEAKSHQEGWKAHDNYEKNLRQRWKK